MNSALNELSVGDHTHTHTHRQLSVGDHTHTHTQTLVGW